MLKIGLTGSIGSGKTTVGRIFSALGVPVYEADSASKRLLLENAEIRERIRLLFGHGVFSGEQPDTGRLAALVFSDGRALQQLNAVMHPAVASDFEAWLERQHDAAYIIKEAAILFEAGAAHGLDYVIAVTAPEALRKHRTHRLYAGRPDQFVQRQSLQWPEEQKAERADFIIRNDETVPVIPQVLELHRRFSGQAA